MRILLVLDRDLCAKLNITFVFGHALYMKAIHGGKTKNDKIGSKKIASLLRAKMLTMAYVYPKENRATRDLLRRRMYFVHQQSELFAHIKNTNTQYNLPLFAKRIDCKSNRQNLTEHFPEPMVRQSIEAWKWQGELPTFRKLFLPTWRKVERVDAGSLLSPVPGG